MTWFDVARRLIRKAQHRCWVCGRDLAEKPKQHNGYVYCSIECACYDGTFNVRKGWIRKPSPFLGICVAPKQHHDYRE
jgi:hypothetical protein